MTPHLYSILRGFLESGDDSQKRHAEFRLAQPDAIDYTLPLGYVPPAPLPKPVPNGKPHAGRAIAPALDEWRIVTLEDLARDTVALCRALPPEIDLVAAVSRSGLVPGGIVASMLHAPLWTVTGRHGMTDPKHGYRLIGNEAETPRHVLVIDDTAATGWEMPNCANHVRDRWPDAKITRAVVYCHPQASAKVDLIYALYPGPHFLTWNFCNAGHGAKMGFDLDGLITEEWYEGRSDLDAKPFYLPRRKSIPLIVTARVESRRPDTEAWLARWRVRCERLVMRDWEPTFDWATEVAEWKAETIKAAPIMTFAESDPYQAEVINRISGKAVFCPAAGRVFPPIRLATDAPRRPCCK